MAKEQIEDERMDKVREKWLARDNDRLKRKS